MRLKTLFFAATVLLASAGASAKTIIFSNFDQIADPPSQGGFRQYAAGTVVDGWTAGANGIEIQRGAAGAPFSGTNLVELDTTANSSMSINLGPGRYKVIYHYSPRPNVAATSNTINLSIGSTLLDTITGQGGATTNWSKRTVKFFTPTGGALTFAAAGTSDSRGGYLDDITVSAPEASTWMMLILGFGLAGYSLRRNRRVAIA